MEGAMSRMVRKQVYLDRRQDEILKAKAAETGPTESELIRRAIEQLARQRPAPESRDAEA
jgi:hypothetical protein